MSPSAIFERERETPGYEPLPEAHTVVAKEGGACSLPEVGGAFDLLGHSGKSRDGQLVLSFLEPLFFPGTDIKLYWLVFKAHRLVYHSILGWRVIKKKEEDMAKKSQSQARIPGMALDFSR